MFAREICNLPDEFVERVVKTEEQIKSLTKELRESKKLVQKLEKETADMRLVCGALKKIPGGIKGRITAMIIGVMLISAIVDLSIKVTGFDKTVKQKIISVMQ